MTFTRRERTFGLFFRGGAAARLIVVEQVRRRPGCAQGGGVVTLAGTPENTDLGHDIVRRAGHVQCVVAAPAG